MPAGSLQLDRVEKTFDDGTRAVATLDLNIPAGQFVALLGPSGCGKSTLLRIIARLEPPTRGEVSVLPDGARIAYVFQDAHLLPWRSVLSNVALPLELLGVARAARLEAAREAIAMVGLSDFAARYPAQLSGGMRMRVSLARALVTRPDVLLLDEPFAALDEITRQSLDEQLYQLWRARRFTAVFVTHSLMEATYLAQRVVVLSSRPARVMLDHPIDLPEVRPAMIRTEPHFAHQTRTLLDALTEGHGT